MDALRTPDDRFVDLEDFPYEPCYVEVDDSDGGRLRMHYVESGPAGGEMLLCLHGRHRGVLPRQPSATNAVNALLRLRFKGAPGSPYTRKMESPS